jgi:hypothetical protein
MKALYAKLLQFLAGVGGAVILTASVLAYFVRRFDSTSGIWFDGFGRRLYDAPFSAFTGVDEWVGLWDSLFDAALFWTGIGTVYWLIRTARKISNDA